MIALLVLQNRDGMNSALSLHTFDISDDDERLGQLCACTWNLQLEEKRRAGGVLLWLKNDFLKYTLDNVPLDLWDLCSLLICWDPVPHPRMMCVSPGFALKWVDMWAVCDMWANHSSIVANWIYANNSKRSWPWGQYKGNGKSSFCLLVGCLHGGYYFCGCAAINGWRILWWRWLLQQEVVVFLIELRVMIWEWRMIESYQNQENK